MRDDAGRITKYVELRLEVEGAVTRAEGSPDTAATWDALLRALSQQGGALTYTGRGYQTLKVNQAGGVRDVAFGPKPEVLDFVPLGGGKGALLTWACTLCLPELPGGSTLVAGLPPAAKVPPVLQMGYDCTVTYGEDGYAGIKAAGILEIPLTRTPAEARKLATTVDDYRASWLDLQFDLTNFKVVHREFVYSKDRRTINWSYELRELAPMTLPPWCTAASGSMKLRPLKAGKALAPVFKDYRWQVTLSATYTVRRDCPRRTSAEAFYALLWYRMQCADFSNWGTPGGKEPDMDDTTAAAQQPPVNVSGPLVWAFVEQFLPTGTGAIASFAAFWAQLFAAGKAKQGKNPRAILMSFEFDEGLYDDSRRMSYSATWTAILPLTAILKGTGIWNQAIADPAGGVWSATMKKVGKDTTATGIMGQRSWLLNSPNPAADVVVDFGLTSGEPSAQPFAYETVTGPK